MTQITPNDPARAKFDEILGMPDVFAALEMVARALENRVSALGDRVRLSEVLTDIATRAGMPGPSLIAPSSAVEPMSSEEIDRIMTSVRALTRPGLGFDIEELFRVAQPLLERVTAVGEEAEATASAVRIFQVLDVINLELESGSTSAEAFAAAYGQSSPSDREFLEGWANTSMELSALDLLLASKLNGRAVMKAI